MLRCALICASIAIAYLPAIQAGFVWDDDDYVTENVTLRSLAGLRTIWLEPLSTPQYYPLTHSSFWLEYHLWGLNPKGYHITNILLHAVNAVLLWRILRLLAVPGAYFAALVFALHPVHVESVAWITERKNVLSGMLYLLAILSYLRFVGLRSPRATWDDLPQRSDWRAYLLSLALFGGALLSKSVTGTLPAALAIIVWGKRPCFGRRDALALAPFFVLGAGMGLFTAWLEKVHVGARGPEWDLTTIERALVAGRALTFYTTKLLWPSPLIFTYDRWDIDASIWWQYLFPLTALSLIALLWFGRHRIGKGPLAAVMFFGGTLAPALGFVDVYPMRFSFVADHFQYLASVGIIGLMCALLVAAMVRVGWLPQDALTAPPAPSTRVRPFSLRGLLLCALVLATLGTLTFRRSLVYAHAETLWQDTVQQNPSSWLAHYNLGNLLRARGEQRKAADHYVSVIRILAQGGAATPPQREYVWAHNNLGIVLAELGQYRDAVAAFRQVLRISPTHARAHYNLGMALAEVGDFDGAIRHYRRALVLTPDDAAVHNNLGVLLAEQGQPVAAAQHFRRALELAPDFEAAQGNLAEALATPRGSDE